MSNPGQYFYRFDPQPDTSEIPQVMPSPFSGATPHALAVRAAEELKTRLEAGSDTLPHDFTQKHRGKMFGVLVVEAPDGHIGYLSAFSGLLGDQWLVEDFVPPVFDLPALNAFWPAERAEIYRLNREITELTDGEQRRAILARRAQVEEQWNRDAKDIDARHYARKQHHRTVRAQLERIPDAPEAQQALAQLASDSWDNYSERRRFRKRKRQALARYDDELAALDAKRHALKAERARRSAAAQTKILACYRLENFQGEACMLDELFEPHPPSGGAGDCAAPKLLIHACRLGLRPLALAEFWWGRGSSGGGRHHGAFYPACRSKCEPILPWILKGVAVDPIPLFGTAETRSDEPLTVYEDEYLAIVNKPAGMLSMPGRNTRLDSVHARLAQRYPKATGPLLVHRLDMDTSGLLIMAKTLDVYRAMQQLFTERQIEKEYHAYLDGEPLDDEGIITLPLRPDPDDRPRQVVDRLTGRPALTRWRVVSRHDGKTRVALFPETGRTHQLRVHAAHTEGLGCPIIGDILYGRAATRMLLHARTLRFNHPVTSVPITVTADIPF